ncbi:DUF4173 domain-containing protein [Ensifer sp. LCM 4579]|uniref:DUF4153 domain-containing protein n=1 Tax=Ensifer sp. LCM 4579 TaxID=1848292 RepID=UPI0008DAA52D|nr:DUF4173 domain-containing protein [Ensifer sp. LCM 4579]OHV72633.1 hypothetical protein LCM4579_11020 [Ensifer sp. LCM 4579]
MTTTDGAVVQQQTGRRNGNMFVLLTLVASADALFFQQPLGINMFLFAIAVTAGVLLSASKPLALRSAVALAAVAFVASVPLLESPSIPGAFLAAFGIAVAALARSRLMPQRLTALPSVLLRFALAAPMRLAGDWNKSRADRASHRQAAKIVPKFIGWLVPGLFTLVFLTLLSFANPLIEQVLSNIDFAAILALLHPWRLAFWLVAATTVWALLRPRLTRRRRRAARGETGCKAFGDNLFGQAAVFRSLLIFNALFAVQTTLDLVYLWGGADLPDGMTHAEYAHRGAYPLIVTALLAGAFVLVAMRSKGPGEKSPVIRGLVHAWIGQNILLCISSILRLDLYVEAYSLTELRVAAGIWMGLVAVGLALILLRILLRRSNEWLIAMNLTVLAATLYVCAFTDFPALIARFNVEHSRALAGEGMPLDLDYVYSLGPAAVPALDTYIAALAQAADETAGALSVRTRLEADALASESNWRSWSFRTHRLRRYLSGHKNFAWAAEGAKNDPQEF